MYKLSRYSNLILILVLFILAIFIAPLLDLLLHYLSDTFGIYTAIILGFFYSFSFTGGAAAVTLTGVESNFFQFAILSALGSVIADLTILKIIKTSLQSEINLLINSIQKKLNTNFSISEHKYLNLLFGIIIIGSPLPDEIGVYILNSSKLLNKWQFLFISFFANFVFVYLLMVIM